jgi:hypothetical protein
VKARRVEAHCLSVGDILLTPQGDRLLVKGCVQGEKRVGLLLATIYAKGYGYPERRKRFSVPASCRFLRERKAA